jgi:DNA-binding MurR/RpiR family transcriptional regulator
MRIDWILISEKVPIPYIFGLFFRLIFEGISRENMAYKMVRLRTSINWILKLPLIRTPNGSENFMMRFIPSNDTWIYFSHKPGSPGIDESSRLARKTQVVAISLTMPSL